ncbi:hypothetical protein AACH06_27510 [Ideonella sp. DXS29W]|uniref:Uncharacterized protein n=1 Tax=Ideonella lacteola TaxID=2984193 RepID=A0ABU9C167_9BURK
MSARTHHFRMKYLMAQLALQGPQRFLDKFRPGGDERFFTDLWTAVGRELDPAERLPNEGASVWHRPADAQRGELVVLTLPAPAAVSEAYFIGVLFQATRCRVFCLEHSEHPMTKSASTVLSELAANGRSNWGEAVATDREAFAALIDALVSDPDAAPLTFTPIRLA